MVYSLYNPFTLGDSINCRVGRGVRFDSNGKMKTSLLIELSKEEVGVSFSDKAINSSKNTPVIPSVASTEKARVQAKVEFDLEVQKIDYQGNTNSIDLAEFKLKEISRNKLVKSLNLTTLIDEGNSTQQECIYGRQFLGTTLG